ncbi:MAG: hypothetical protein GYA33_09065, partial [Thermogutta sp.]|nr:hypothetical protein [Thermogutta sp.]
MGDTLGYLAFGHEFEDYADLVGLFGPTFQRANLVADVGIGVGLAVVKADDGDFGLDHDLRGDVPHAAAVTAPAVSSAAVTAPAVTAAEALLGPSAVTAAIGISAVTAAIAAAAPELCQDRHPGEGLRHADAQRLIRLVLDADVALGGVPGDEPDFHHPLFDGRKEIDTFSSRGRLFLGFRSGGLIRSGEPRNDNAEKKGADQTDDPQKRARHACFLQK